MYRCIGLSVLIFILAIRATPVSAQRNADTEKIDVAAITCNDLLLGALGGGEIPVWIFGYFAGQNGETAIDLKALEGNLQKFADYCRSHESAKALAAIKEALK